MGMFSKTPASIRRVSWLTWSGPSLGWGLRLSLRSRLSLLTVPFDMLTREERRNTHDPRSGKRAARNGRVICLAPLSFSQHPSCDLRLLGHPGGINLVALPK